MQNARVFSGIRELNEVRPMMARRMIAVNLLDQPICEMINLFHQNVMDVIHIVHDKTQKATT